MLSADECQALFAEHLEWSKLVARRVHQSLPPSFSLEDLEQEAAIALWESVQKYDRAKNDNVRGFAYLAVRGAVLMSIRRKWYREATNEELEPTHQAPTGDNPAEAYERRVTDRKDRRRDLDRIRIIEKRLARFPDSLQFAAYIVRRVHLEGAPVDEMATITGMPAARIQRLLASGLRHLKRPTW
jgi:RNA polymerase sigma factor (sigma-70 family)